MMITIGNDYLSRTFAIKDGRLCTSHITNLQAGTSYSVAPDSDEFTVELVWERLGFRHGNENPRRFTTRDFRVVSVPVPGLAGVFELECSALGLHLEIAIEADATKPYLRKTLRLRPDGREPVFVNHLAVEALGWEAPVPHHGGFGQPLFGAGYDWFAGTEYPAARNDYVNGVVLCGHYGEGLLPVGQVAASESVVWGSALPGQADDAFLAYIDGIRARPVRSFIHYNTWFDLQHVDVNEAKILDRIEALDREMTQKRGVSPAAFVIDDHWDDRASLWDIDASKFPNGFHPITKRLSELGIEFGMWFGPIGGYGRQRQERLCWYASQGYETTTNGQYLCLAGKRYHSAFLEQLHRKLTEYPINYLKFDGMAFGCHDPGHGHGLGMQSREALVRSFIRVLEEARALRPEINLTITTGIWLSPWWLRWADSVFIGGEDYGWADELPSREDRDAAITYRDGVLFDDFRVRQDRFPLNSLKSVGIIKGALCLLGGEDESTEGFRKQVVMAFTRGVMQIDLLVSPDILKPGEWDDLCQSLRWAQDNADVLLHHGEMVLGDPRRGEIYGYLHRGERQSFAVLRNPSFRPQWVRLPVNRWFPSSGQQPHVLWQLYPVRKALSLDTTRGEDTVRMLLHPFGLAVVSCQRREDSPGLLVGGVPFDAAGNEATCYLPQRVASIGLASSESTHVEIDGRRFPLEPRETKLEVGNAAPVSEYWAVCHRLTDDGHSFEALWDLDPSVSQAEIVACGEWPKSAEATWSSSDEGPLKVRQGRTKRWSLVTVALAAKRGTTTLTCSQLRGHFSIWLWLRRQSSRVAMRSSQASIACPDLPVRADHDTFRETYLLWEGE